MPFVVLLIVAFTVGLAVFLAASRVQSRSGEPATDASIAAEEGLARTTARNPWLARLLQGRLDPETATGLALTLALAVAIVGGIVLGLLAYLMRSSGELVALDR